MPLFWYIQSSHELIGSALLPVSMKDCLRTRHVKHGIGQVQAIAKCVLLMFLHLLSCRFLEWYHSIYNTALLYDELRDHKT